MANKLNKAVPAVANKPTPIPVRHLAWAAGFIDGEGCIAVSRVRLHGRKNETYRMTLNVTQNHLPALLRLQQVLGQPSHLYQVRRTVQHNKQVHSLNYDGIHALRAIARVAPYLVRKRMEARVALSYRRRGAMGVHPGPTGYPAHVWRWREHVRRKLQRLK